MYMIIQSRCRGSGPVGVDQWFGGPIQTMECDWLNGRPVLGGTCTFGSKWGHMVSHYRNYRTVRKYEKNE